MTQTFQVKQERPVHYINGKDMYAELVTYHAEYLTSLELGLDKPQVSKKLAQCFIQIATRLCNSWNFSGYTYKDEMIADGIMKCLDKAHRFDPSVSEQSFSFFSQICWNSAINRIKLEQHQSSVKAKMIREKMSSEFVAHGVDSATDDDSNGFVEFLKSTDAYTDYHADRAEKAKATGYVHHKNKTPYKTKEVLEKEVLPFSDLTSFEA